MPHAHGDITHDHPDPAPGHTHDDEADRESGEATRESRHDVDDAERPARAHDERPPEERHDEAPPEERREHAPREPAPAAALPVTAGLSGLVIRVVLTVLGAAAMIGGAFLPWATFAGITGRAGTQLPVDVFWSAAGGEAGLLASAGLVLIVLGVVTLVGLVPPTGWLTRLAGALAIIAFALFLVTLYRVQEIDLGITNIGVGMWLVLVGGLLAVVGGFFGPRRGVTTVPV